MKKPGVLIDISTACPHRCVYCAHQRDRMVKPEFMDAVDFENIIAILEREKFDRIHLYMSGEPTAHILFAEFLRIVGILGFDVTVATKAGLPLDWERITLAHFAFDDSFGKLRWLIEIPGIDKKTTSKICKIDHDQQIKNLKHFGRIAQGRWERIGWKVVTIVTRWNECELQRIKEWLSSVGLKNWSIKRPGYFIRDNKNGDWLPSEQFARRLSMNRTKCPFPNNVAINVKGNVSVCCHDMLFKMNLGNVVKEGTLQGILDRNSDVMKKRLSMELPICERCN